MPLDGMTMFSSLPRIRAVLPLVGGLEPGKKAVLVCGCEVELYADRSNAEEVAVACARPCLEHDAECDASIAAQFERLDLDKPPPG